MELLPSLTLQPGVYTEGADRDVIGRWKLASNVRFFKGNPEKIGGWVKQIATPFAGVCRAMLAWTTLTFSRFCALGTSSKLYLTDSTSFFDITPLDSSGTLGTNPFTTTTGSTVVSVADTAHDRQTGDYVHFSGATNVGGVVMNGEFIVTTVVDDDHYQFDAGTAASSGATGGGASVAYQYEIHVGLVDSIFGSGWGMGTWGSGTWGTPRVSGRLQLARIWSLTNWGEDLLASPINMPIYVWTASSGTNARAVLISEAPAQNRRILVSAQLRVLISLGSHDGTDPDPMLIRWSDSEDYTNWTPDITNLAGDQRLDDGNEIIAALLSRNEIVVITDTTVWSMTLTGDDLVFAFDSKGQTAGLIGPNGAVDVNGTVYCMGRDQFYTYDGQVKELPCDVYSKVFGDPDNPGLNYTQAAKVFAVWNPIKAEVIWFYPGPASQEVDRCVGISTTDSTWWLGTMDRTAWISRHPFSDQIRVPLGTAVTPAGNFLYDQETGVDADGAPLPYFAQSYDAELTSSSNVLTGVVTGQGQNVYRIKRIIPNFIRLAGQHFAQITGRKWPNDPPIVRAMVPFGPQVRHIDSHLRARQISVMIGSNALGADISIGGWRVDENRGGFR